MGSNVDLDQISDFETNIEQQKNAASQGHQDISDIIQALQKGLAALEERENFQSEAEASLADQATACVNAARSAVEENAKGYAEVDEQLEDAERQITELEAKLGNSQNLARKLEAAEQRIQQLQGEVEDRAESATSAEATKARLEKMEKAFKEQAEAIELGQAARRRVAELETTLEEYKQAAIADRDRVINFEETIAELRREEQAARDDLNALQERSSESVGEAENASVRISELSAELEQVKTQANDLEEKTNTAESDAQEFEKSADEALVALNERSSALEEAEARLAAIEGDTESLRSETESIRSRARETAESERLKSEALECAEAELQELRKQVNLVPELTERVKDLKQRLEEESARAKDIEEELAEELGKGTKAQLAEQMTAALKDRESAQAQVKELKKQLSEAQNSIDASDAEKKTARKTTFPEARRRMGELLVEAEVISAGELERALFYQQEQESNKHLGQILVDLGYTDEETIAQAVAHQSKLEFMHLDEQSIDEATAHLINGRLAKMHSCIPVREENGRLLVAMENPLDLIAIEDVERATELPVDPVVAPVSDIQSSIDYVYFSNVN